MRRYPPSKWIRKARRHLAEGGVIAYPTEYCYGLGCLPTHARGLRRLLKLKKRPQHKGMIVIGYCLGQLYPLIDVKQSHRASIEEIWPAQISLVVPAHPKVLPALRGARRKGLAIRIPNLSWTRELTKRLNQPLVSTSANRNKQRPLLRARDLKYLRRSGVLVYKERVGDASSPSQIVDFLSGTRLR